MIGISAAATAFIPPEASGSCRCPTWTTPSEAAAASLSPSRSSRSPRRTFAPSADSAAAALSDRARPVTSCPAATSSGMMYEPEWPVPPVTKTRMLMLLVQWCSGGSGVAEEVRVESVENADTEGDVEAFRAVPSQAHQQQPDPFQPAGHVQATDVEWTQSEAFDERRHTRFGPRVIAGVEHVQRVSAGQDVAKHSIESLHDVRARRSGLADLLRTGSAIGSDHPGGFGVEGVRDVDDHLAGQRLAVLGDDLHGAGVRHGQDDDVAGRDSSECSGRCPAAERGGQVLRLGRVAADEFDGVA